MGAKSERIAFLEGQLAEKDRRIAELELQLAIEKASHPAVVTPWVPQPTIPGDRTWYPRPYEIWCSGSTTPTSSTLTVTV